MFSVQLPRSHKAAQIRSEKARRQFWKSRGFSTLSLNSLVCICAHGQPLLFGTIVRRDPAELALETPVIGIAFQDVARTQQLLEQIGSKTLAPDVVMVQVGGNQRLTD
jgi:hypothetical protein